jgi:asparagine synthase (glutamine-hydrolysing)
MCGIWSIVSKEVITTKKREILYEHFKKISGRGPEDHEFVDVSNKCIVGFHRLRINDTSDKGNQPFIFEDERQKIYLICNGEIYNHKILEKEHGFEMSSKSDCEIILHLFRKIGIEETVKNLKGVFAGVVIHHDKLTHQIMCFPFRDRIGVRPMFYGFDENSFSFCSEMKGILYQSTIRTFKPAHYGSWNCDMSKAKHSSYWDLTTDSINFNEEHTYELIRQSLNTSVKMRMMSDRPVCSLLSGGLDSSLISALVAKFTDHKLHTFSIGMEGGTDLKYAKIVADHIGSNHQEVLITKNEGLQALKDVIRICETFDITTIRASVGQYLICKHIGENTDFKVVYIGDGSDELTGGYKYFCKAPSYDDFDQECRKLLKNIHKYDVLRADRAVACHGIETRVPFLDSDFIDLYLSIESSMRYPKHGIEKFLLRKAFDNTNILPDEILWREKEAFSDGISSQKDSWFSVIQNYINETITDLEFEENKNKFEHCPPLTKEAYFYRKIFNETYGDKCSNVIDQFWMPKWCGDIIDPSARILDHYQSNKN